MPDPRQLPLRNATPSVDLRAWSLLHGDISPAQHGGSGRLLTAAIHEAKLRLSAAGRGYESDFWFDELDRLLYRR